MTSGCQSQGFHLEIIDEEPESYVNISEDRMHKFPHLKEAIQNHNTFVKAPAYSLDEVRGFLTLHDTNYIYYNNTYYKVRIWSAD
jgi:hypothetical protein